MGFIDNDHAVLREQRIGEQFPDDHTVGHVLDAGIAGRLFVETNSVSDNLTQRRTLLLGDTSS